MVRNMGLTPHKGTRDPTPFYCFLHMKATLADWVILLYKNIDTPWLGAHDYFIDLEYIHNAALLYTTCSPDNIWLLLIVSFHA